MFIFFFLLCVFVSIIIGLFSIYFSSLANNTAFIERTESVTDDDVQTSRQMLFIIGLFVSFVCITLFAVWIIARRRKLGNDNAHHTDLEYSKLMSRC